MCKSRRKYLILTKLSLSNESILKMLSSVEIYEKKKYLKGKEMLIIFVMSTDLFLFEH